MPLTAPHCLIPKLGSPLSLLLVAVFLLTMANTAPALAFENTAPTAAAPEFKYKFSTSLWTTHFNPKPEHNNEQNFLGIERRGQNRVSEPLNKRFSELESATPLVGVAFFKNSFSQSTVYAYAGYEYTYWEQQNLSLYGKLTAGFIHGYRNEFQHKIPFNHFGTAPAAVPSFGLRYQQADAEIVLFGLSGVMLLIGYKF